MDRRRAAVDQRIAAAAAEEEAEAPINKDKFTYEKERERFLLDLRQFHEGRGTSVPRWPYIGGKPVDLHALYTAVTQLGGWEKVSSDETWADVQEQFGIPVSCSNADYALRQIYIRYLNAYERLHHFGLDPDSHDDGADLDDLPSSHRKIACPASGVAVTYNYQQHNLLDSTREMLGLPKESSCPTEYSRIERSLMSGLPNELDFAVNICLLLSTEGKHTLKGIGALRVVELLLSHVGICKEAELALIWLIPESKLNFLKFWNESVNDHEVKELLCPECLLVDKVEEYQMENKTEVCDVDLSRVLHVGRGVGAEDREAQRVIQLAVILRNLSLEEENLEFFASSLIVFRFVMMCVYCSSSCIRQLALDTLANIAFKIDVLFLHKMSVEPVDCGLSQLVLKTISAFLTSPDKFEVVSALEVLSRLCQVELNEDAISTQLGDAIYEHLVRLLTIHDLQLMVSALETIYQLSEIGMATSNRIANVRSSVDVLVALLTVEAQSYGPCNLPGILATENTLEVQNPVQNQTMGPPSARPAPSVNVRPSLPLPCVASHVMGTPNGQLPLPPVPLSSPIVALSVPSSLTSQSLGSSIRSASGPLVTDSEAAACNWLLAQYELSPNSSLKKMEMYRKYASVFGVYGLQNLVSPMSFANCIRVTFPSVEQESVDKDGASEVIYKGIAFRQMPASFSPSGGDLQSGGHPLVSSTGAVPGLIRVGQTTTQLAPPPSAFVFSKAVTFPAIQQVLQSNQGRQQNSLLITCSDGLTPSSAVRPATMAPTETNFVKTLLASKVVQNMNRCQVQLTDSQDTTSQQAIVGANTGANVGCHATDALSSNTKQFTGMLPTVHPQDSHCKKTDAAVTIGEVSRGVVNKNSYSQITKGFDVVLERLSSDEGRFSLNCCKQTACSAVQTRPLDSFASLDRCRVANVPVVMNGELGLNRLSGKSRNNLAEDDRTTDRLNGKEPLPALNGIVKDLGNSDCFGENSNPEFVQLPTEKMESWSSVAQNEPVNVHCASGSNNTAARDVVSPFPRNANVDGLSDDVLEETPQDGDKTARIDLSHLCHDPGHSGAAVDKGRSQLSQFEMDCSNSETGVDNSEILLLEDFTVACEEVLASDIPEDGACSQVAEGTNSSWTFSSLVRETESDSLFSSPEISRGISSSVMQNSHSLDSVQNTNLMSHPLPITIPVSIQAKLTSLQDTSPSLSMIQPQLPFSATDAAAISQSSALTVFQRPLINQNYCASFFPVVPVNDTGQQHLNPEIISSRQGSCEITGNLSAESALQINSSRLHLAESQLVSTNATQSAAVVMDPSAGHQLSRASANQNAQQTVVAHPQGIQSIGIPLLQENSMSVPLTSANSSACPRLQFMTSMTSNLSNSVQIPQLHRFVAASTPGRIIIQRAQVVPQGQQPQSLRPLQQPFYQRFVVSQPGGLPQRQILIQSSQVLMHQSAQGIGHARPVVMAPAGQILAQQGHTGQPAHLTAFRLAPMTNHSGNLVQHQGQQLTQSNVQQGQVLMQQSQQIGQQDAKSVGLSVDQQSQGHGQAMVPNQPVNFQQGQLGQVITHQGQASHIFAQQGQLLVGQQGQILCHPGHQGQSSNPLLIQRNGGQFVFHSASNNLPGCLMSIPVSSLQNGIGIKRLVETSKDQTVGPSLMLPPCLTASSVARCIVTATMPLNLGPSVTTGAQSSQVTGEASPSSSVSSAKRRKPTAVMSQSKKRKKEGEDETVGDGEVGQGRAQVQFLCEWNGCQRFFGSFNSIFQHVTKDHFEALNESSVACEWTGCDSLKRQRWSFMTHLQERHLNEASLRAAAARRQQQQQGGCGSPLPPALSAAPTAAAVYPPNAAVQAIRRFSSRPPFPEFSDAKEGPISRHIHLTSALILRNLARYSLLGRSLMKRHEKHLALIAFSETESSSAISNCLWELHRH